MATRDELYSTATIRIASALRPLFGALTVTGCALAVLAGWRPGVVLVLVGVSGALGAQLVVGVVAYRRAMGAAWPDVRPVADDDWD